MELRQNVYHPTLHYSLTFFHNLCSFRLDWHKKSALIHQIDQPILYSAHSPIGLSFNFVGVSIKLYYTER